MDKEKLKKFQLYLFEMLCSFDDFCNSNGLQCILVGGTALGAYRHKGFIPWDDDIDLAMERKQFEQMEAAMKAAGNRLGSIIYSPVEESLVPEAPVGHLYYTGLTDELEHAPKIDIHPLDGVPEGSFAKKKQKYYALLYYLGIYHHPTKNKGSFWLFASRTALAVIPKSAWKGILRRTKKYLTRCDVEKSEYLCSLFGVAGYEREVMPVKWVFPLTKTEFEGREFFVPNNRDCYLERLYRDWQSLPPEDKRKPAHESYLYIKD